MRTSKKLLSLFLAVVMIITTCSVGFTAFAKDYDDIWTTSADAETAFDAIEGLVDDYLPALLMGVDSISAGVYQKYADEMGVSVSDLTDSDKEEIDNKATLTDILQSLQTTLIEALAGTDINEYFNDLGSSAAGSSASYYEYLNPDDYPNTVSFYTLYTIAKDYRNNTSLSGSTRSTLTEWYNLFLEIYNVSNSLDDKIAKLNDDFVANYDYPQEHLDYVDTTPTIYEVPISYLESYFTDEYMAENCSESELAALQVRYDDLTEEYLGYGAPEDFSVDSFAEYIAYSDGMYATYKSAYIMQKAVDSVNGTLIFTSVAGDDVLDFGLEQVDGQFDVTAEIALQVVLEMYGLNSIDDLLLSMGITSDSGLYAYFNAMLEANIVDTFFIENLVLSSNENYMTVIKGLTVCYGGITEEEFDEAIDEGMPDGWETGTVLSDEDIMDIGGYIRITGSQSNNTTRLAFVNSFAEGVIPNSLISSYSNSYAEDTDEDGTLPSAFGNNYYGQWLTEALDQAGGTYNRSTAFYYGFMNDFASSAEHYNNSDIYNYYIPLQDGCFLHASTQTVDTEQGDDGVPYYYSGSGVSQMGGVYPYMVRSENTHFVVLSYGDDYNYFSREDIDGYTDSALRYAYNQVAMNVLGSDILQYTSYNGGGWHAGDGYFWFDVKYDDYIESTIDDTKEELPTLTERQEAILYDSYNLSNDMGTEILNLILNNTISSIVTNDFVVGMVESLFVSDIVLEVALIDLWQNLCDEPVETIFELISVLLVIIDDLLPFLLCGDGDPWDGSLYGLLLEGELDLGEEIDFMGYGYDYNSYIGVSQLNWDLNELLPDLMHWLLATKEEQDNRTVDGIGFYVDEDTTNYVYVNNNGNKVRLSYTGRGVSSANFTHYTVIDSNDNELAYDSDTGVYTYNGSSSEDLNDLVKVTSTTTFYCMMTYEAKVPKLTGIYIADYYLADAKVEDLGSLLEDAGLDEAVADGLAEIITEFATLFSTSLDEYVASDYRKEAKYKDGELLCTGLNNIMVSLPRLIDIMEDLAADKYGGEADAWTFCYDGKIEVDTTGGVQDGSTLNVKVQEFKEYASSSADDRSVDILDIFVDGFVNDWLNSIFDLLNIVFTTDNSISSNIPIISALIDSIGGLGEESILSDILNSIFQLKRGDDYSFELLERDNGYVGLSSDSAYFLLANINKLVDVIIALVDSFSSDDSTSTTSSTSLTSLVSSLLLASSDDIETTDSSVGSSGYTAEELSDVDTLIASLDEMVYALLEDSTMNDYSLDNSGNIASGLVSLLSNYLTADLFEDSGLSETLSTVIDEYIYYLDGAGTRSADENGDKVNEDVYTNENLSALVVRTFALVEILAQDLLSDYDYINGEQTYNLLAQAISGVISPDAVAIRLDDYPDAQEDIYEIKSKGTGLWSSEEVVSADLTDVKVTIDWGIEDGDVDGFYNGLAASLRILTSILSVLFIDAGIYENALEPILSAIGSKCGVEIDTAGEYAVTSDAGYHDEVLLGLVTPIADYLDAFVESPITTLIETVQGLAGLLDDESGDTIASIVSNTLQPVITELEGLCNILNISSDKLLPLSETFADILQTEIVDLIAEYAVVENNQLPNITIRNYPLCGNNIIPIINTYLSSTGITLPNISWSAISEAQSPADALAYVVEYAVDAVVDRDNDFANLNAIESLVSNDTVTSLLEALKNGTIDGKGVIDILIKILNVTQNPTLVAWSFERYLQEAIEGFSYPLGLTKAQADEAAEDIDAVIDNLFPLLESFGLDIGGSTLEDVISNNLFTNEILTQLTVALYNALTSNSTVATVLDILTIPSSTADVAALLVDTSYGTTYSSVSATIGAVSSWSDLKTVTTNSDGSTTTTYASINWGFTDGAANAQQGFVNALAAILRPFNNVLAVFLNSGELTIGDELYNYLCTLNVAETQRGDDATMVIENGVITFTIIDADKSDSTTSTIKLDLTALTNLKNLSIYGTNGYNSAIIPLLEALQCGGIVTDAQYQSDVAAAKDNLLLDILNPILGSSSTSLLNQITASPIVAIATILPNIAVYLDASGLSQAVNNLLAPITDLLADLQGLVDLDTMLAVLLGASDGQSLADYVASLLGMSAGSVSLDLTDISTINLEDMLIPLLNLLLEDYNLVLADIDWNALISLGDRTTYTSAATDTDGNALTGKKLTNVDYGKSLIVVLRYVCNFLINNVTELQSLILSIKSNGTPLSENATISAIIVNIFTQIKTHTADEIIVAIYYFFVGDTTDDYWDYSNYQTKKNTFKYPDGVSKKNIKALIEFLDGIIGELDLGSLLDKYLYTDSIINSLAKAMYQGIEDVTISDSITLNDMFDIVGMSCSKDTVVALLRDSSYGKTKQFASAANIIEAAASWDAVDFDSISWGVTNRDSFVTALTAVLRPFMGLLDVILADGSLNILEGIDIPGSNGYVSTIVPLLEAFQCPNIKNYTQYLADKNKAYDNLLVDILNPILDLVDEIIESPIATIAQILPNLALFIGNDGLIQLVENLLTPITAIVKDVLPIIDVDKLLQDLTGMEKLSITNIGTFLEPYLGSGKLISFLNEYLSVVGFELPEIDWLALASLGTVKNTNSVVTVIGLRKVVTANTSQVFVAVLEYVLDLVLDNATLIKGLIGDSYAGTLKTILDIIFDLDSDDIIRLLSQIVDLTQSPTEVFWTYEKYKAKYKSFSYPDGITADDADEAVTALDDMVNGIFSLLQGLDVVDSADLSGLVSDLLYTNDILTSLATALYGALDKDNISPYLELFGIDVSTKGVAKLLTDKSYGKTYTSAAKAIKSKSSWSKVSDVNWGFTDGAANAEQGFINALTAILRPFLDVLGPFLNGSSLKLGNILMDLICMINTSSGDKSKGETLITMKNGVLKIKTQSNGKYSTALKLDFTKLDTLASLNLYGSNGYENSIVPLLDVLQVDNSEIKSYNKYIKDCKKAKDNILLDILNPLMSFVDDVLEAPFDTITSVLPNLAYFLDNNGIGQLLDNILAPVTELLKDLKKDGIDIDEILELLLGNDLGTLITDLIKSNGKTLTSILKKDGITLNLTLTNLKACNIQDILVPLINALLSNTGITLPDFEWSTIASHGEVVTSTSKAENSTGKFTNKEVIADKGEVLVAVLRYVADLLIKNAGTLKSLLGSIDAIKNSDLLSGIISSIFNTLSIASKDEIVLAVFYFLNGEPTNAFWDYTDYETGEYEFSYPENMDVDFLKSLSPMLDGLIIGLIDLNTIVADALYKDSLISSLAVGLYGAIEGVSISDSITLTDLLAMTDIDFSTDNVAKLLTDSDCGQTYSSAASVISSAGSWANVDEDSLTWGVTDRDSFMSALCAVLRPFYGVLDVLLNDAYLGLFDIVRIPGSNGYTSTIVPLLEALSCYNIKTQYQYREDINEAYDNILLDIINPIWDKVEDLLYAPIQVLASMLPNLALFIGNDGLCQILDTLLTPISVLIDSIKCVVDLNDLVDIILDALDVDLNSLLAQIGITNFSLDLYDINATLKPILGGDAIIPLINNILGLIEIGDTTLGIKLNDVDWLQCASHGETIVNASQAATYGSRIYVEGDASETLIAVLRYLIDTINTGDNFQVISDLIASLLGDSVSEGVSEIIDQVLEMLQGDTDTVISDLVDLLQTFA
ncbi:MAG: hypothetical protein LUG95_05525 [Clostridiales bacterium]|nr:hypothetical protein [Clostridiales bacterium]